MTRKGAGDDKEGRWGMIRKNATKTNGKETYVDAFGITCN